MRSLVESGGGRFIEGTVERVLPKERTLVLEDGCDVPYDAVSFCLGSETKGMAGIENANSIPVKPIENVLKIREAVSRGDASSPLVVGEGRPGARSRRASCRMEG